MKFPLTAELVEEAKRFELRMACRDCFYWIASREVCAHDWPDIGQRRWPIDAPGPDGALPTEASFCKEFELR